MMERLAVVKVSASTRSQVRAAHFTRRFDDTARELMQCTLKHVQQQTDF